MFTENVVILFAFVCSIVSGGEKFATSYFNFKFRVSTLLLFSVIYYAFVLQDLFDFGVAKSCRVIYY